MLPECELELEVDGDDDEEEDDEEDDEGDEDDDDDDEDEELEEDEVSFGKLRICKRTRRKEESSSSWEQPRGSLKKMRAVVNSNLTSSILSCFSSPLRLGTSFKSFRMRSDSCPQKASLTSGEMAVVESTNSWS